MFGRFPVTPTVAASTATKTTNANHLRRCHTARAQSRPETAYPSFAFCIVLDSLGLRRITAGGPVPRPRSQAGTTHVQSTSTATPHLSNSDEAISQVAVSDKASPFRFMLCPLLLARCFILGAPAIQSGSPDRFFIPSGQL